MIDVEDCDARLPSSGDPNDQYTAELLRLSLILGRVLKTIYGYVEVRWDITTTLIDVEGRPTGLANATDEKLQSLLNDMREWQERLPEELKFRGIDTPRGGG